MAFDPHAMQKKDYDQILLIIRALSVFSIVSAHCCRILDNASSVSQFFSCFLSNVGQIGVGSFFLLSGYVYPFSRKNKKDFLSFFSHKFTRIIIPWFFCATIVYLANDGRKGLSLQKWFLSFYHSIFWFMLVLVLLFVIYFFFYHNTFFLLMSVFLSLGSLSLVALRIVPPGDFTVYYNPINWMVFFSSGIFLNQYGLSTFFLIISRLKWGLFFLASLIMLFMTYMHYRFSYSSPFFFPIEALSICAMTGCAIWIYECPLRIKDVFVEIGRRSFSIYLLYSFFFSAAVIWLSNRSGLWITIPLRPLIICGMVYCSLDIGHFVARKMHMDKLFSILVGDRS